MTGKAIEGMTSCKCSIVSLGLGGLMSSNEPLNQQKHSPQQQQQQQHHGVFIKPFLLYNASEMYSVNVSVAH